MSDVVIVKNLSKTYQVTKKEKGLSGSIKSIFKPVKKNVLALKKISFKIGKGELVGFIGPNGAGKTTTLKILSGILYPTSGFTQVLGFEPWERRGEFLRNISLVMGQKSQLWWDLPALDTFELNRQIYNLKNLEYERNLKELVELLDVGRYLDVQVRRLSLGQRMRLELVASLLHKPKVLFLDEPTIGLDVVGQQKIRDFIVEYVKDNKASVILTSHNMDDLVGLAKRVVVIDKGSIAFDGEIKKLIDSFARNKVLKITLKKSADLKKFEEIGKIKNLSFPQVVLEVPRETTAVAAAEVLQNFPVADLNVEEEAISEIIRRVFKGELKLKNNE